MDATSLTSIGGQRTTAIARVGASVRTPYAGTAVADDNGATTAVQPGGANRQGASQSYSQPTPDGGASRSGGGGTGQNAAFLAQSLAQQDGATATTRPSPQSAAEAYARPVVASADTPNVETLAPTPSLGSSRTLDLTV